jgi:hypothetical protein
MYEIGNIISTIISEQYKPTNGRCIKLPNHNSSDQSGKAAQESNSKSPFLAKGVLQEFESWELHLHPFHQRQNPERSKQAAYLMHFYFTLYIV